MTAHRCNCGLPAHDTTICARCSYELERGLAEIPALVTDMDLTLSRQTGVTAQDGGRSAEVALPFNIRVSEVRANLHGTLVGWVRDIHDDDEFYPSDADEDLSRWLLARLDRIRVHPAAEQIVDEIGYAVTEARKAVDRAPERLYAGPCLTPTDTGKCAGELYAKPGAESVKCRDCETVHDLEERRTWLLAAAEDYLAHAALIAQAVTGLGAPVTPERIRKWAERGRITARTVDLEGRALYRVGDVIDLLAADRERDRKAS
jgi:hypothetical protein